MVFLSNTIDLEQVAEAVLPHGRSGKGKHAQLPVQRGF